MSCGATPAAPLAAELLGQALNAFPCCQSGLCMQVQQMVLSCVEHKSIMHLLHGHCDSEPPPRVPQPSPPQRSAASSGAGEQARKRPLPVQVQVLDHLKAGAAAHVAAKLADADKLQAQLERCGKRARTQFRPTQAASAPATPLADVLGYAVQDKALLQQALRHPCAPCPASLFCCCSPFCSA